MTSEKGNLARREKVPDTNGTRLAQELEESAPEVAILAEDSATAVATVEDVVTVAAQSVAGTAWHEGMMVPGGRRIKRKVPCPLFSSHDLV